MAAPSDFRSLVELVARARRLFVLTGAGCSTASGIPDYRNEEGNWKRPQPVTFQDFVKKAHVRSRYWARSMIGWQRFGRAEPNAAHRALRALEDADLLARIVTQNVDGLHQRAGAIGVIDLHGRLDQVRCLACGTRLPRSEFQERLRLSNPHFEFELAATAPDGDADLQGADYEGFCVPSCISCGGMMKPDVVFFGEAVPKGRVDEAFEALRSADGVLVVGSSLTVFSGYRFVREAARSNLPIAVVNSGYTRADELAKVKISARCEEVLPLLADGLQRSASHTRRFLPTSTRAR